MSNSEKLGARNAYRAEALLGLALSAAALFFYPLALPAFYFVRRTIQNVRKEKDIENGTYIPSKGLRRILRP